MYPIPNFAGGGSGGASEMTKPVPFDFNPGGQNQYMNFPGMSPSNTSIMSGLNPNLYGGSSGFPLPMTAGGGTMTTPTQQNNFPPGIVPPANAPGQPFPGTNVTPGETYSAGIGARLPGQEYQGRTVDPGFTSQLDAWLRSMLGQGATPFDLSAILPSTGQATAPGTLTAPENPILQQLQQFYQTGQGGPLPGVLPMWQSAMKSMEIPIQQQLANIKEQFGSRGALGSSEMAQAMETFGAQTAADQEALLGQLTLQALPGMESFGENLQAMDQGSIDRLLQEFQRTRPEYSPLLPEEFGFGTLYPPMYSNKKGDFASAFMGTLGQGLANFVLPGGHS